MQVDRIDSTRSGMAAGQQKRKKKKKRLTNPESGHQLRPPKKPVFGSPSPTPRLNLYSHILLTWDEPSKTVIPTKEQVGIPSSHLAPFILTPSPPPRPLPHVTPVPGAIFALQNLTGVLSYEVWITYLTQADRGFLAQFLPMGTNANQIVNLLLSGKNHHFGNHFPRWSSSLCHGDLHPDAIINKEKQIIDDERAYCAELNNYHCNMIEILEKWKEKWLTCDNLETLFRDNLSKQKRGGLQSPRDDIIFSKTSPPKKEMPMKFLRNGDVTKFMSYIKITKSQHDLVKRMKQSGDGIQTKHLARVIGDIASFHVKPYETFVEDEKRRLHNHWAILSCKDLPAAFKVRRDMKMMVENLRMALCLELAEKNTSVVKAEQAADGTANVGQDGPYQNGDLSGEQEELVEHSPQAVLQAGNGYSTVLDENVKDTSGIDASFHSCGSPNMTHQDVMDMNNTNITTQSQNSSDEHDQDLKNSSCTNTSIDSGNSSDKKDGNLEDVGYMDGISQSITSPGVGDGDMKDTSCKDTALQYHNIPDSGAQEPDAINQVSTSTRGLNSPNMLVQDVENTSYTGLSIQDHVDLDEQNDGLKNISYLRASTDHDMNDIPSSNNNQWMDHMAVDQKEVESIAMIPSDSTLRFSKPLSQQKNVEGLELKEPPAKCEKDFWQSASPVESLYQSPDNSQYRQSNNLQVKHHLSVKQATYMVDHLGIDARRGQQAHASIAAAFPMGNAASLLQPCTDEQNNHELLIRAKGIGMVPSYSLMDGIKVKQSIDLHSMANDGADQSQVCSPLQEQTQLPDQSHNGLYLQQLPKNLYSDAGLCTQETFPMVEQQNFTSHTVVDGSCKWFPDEHLPDNNLSGVGSDGIAAQDMPEGSSADGSLFSVLSQYKQTFSRMQLGALSSEQPLETRNLVPPGTAQDIHAPRGENIVPPGPNMYGYSTQNMAICPSSSDVDASGQWANIAQESHGMPGPCFRQFGGPWLR